MATQRLPPARNLGQAIEGAPTLSALLAGHQRANACFQRMLPVVPPSLRALVRPGPVDGACWTVFVEHSAAAAKLRQLVPALLAAVSDFDGSIAEVKIKIQPRGG